MERILKKGRLAVIFILLAAILTVFGFTLYKLQIIEGDEYLVKSTGTITVTSSVPASRGAILDRNGVVLVDDVVSYNLKLSRSLLLKSADPNGTIDRLLSLLDEHGISHNDTFPVTATGPFSYVVNMSSEQSGRLSSYFKYFKLDSSISAPDFISWLWEHYGISVTETPERARAIIGIRYELELRAILNISEYVFAQEVSLDAIAPILEQDFSCVTVEATSSRRYHTTYAAHILGVVGAMNRTEYLDTYKALNYAYDSHVGKTGAELAFETYLHGTDGTVVTTYDPSGAVTNVEVRSDAQAGQNVYLTIDIGLQAVAEEALASTIASINAERDEDTEKADGGAAVMIDVKTSDVLVCASYPSYDLSAYFTDYKAISEAAGNPLFNRATGGLYNPGSTFKPVTALAALMNGSISRYTPITDEGKYTEYPGFQPTCWIYPRSTHGTLDVVGAIENSCNYYFYSVADMIGIRPISNMASALGLGSKTGIEIDEKTGHVATPEYKKEALNEGWWAADTILAGIGQGHNYFTPLQIANYTATLANNGVLHSVSILKYITTYDYDGIVFEEEPEILNVVDDPEGHFSVIREGMMAVAKTGTAASMFKNYPVKVAAKTGTVQSDTAAINNGVFICYAPADNPEVAVAVVVEKGGSGAGIMAVAKEMLDAYFAKTSYVSAAVSDNALVR